MLNLTAKVSSPTKAFCVFSQSIRHQKRVVVVDDASVMWAEIEQGRSFRLNQEQELKWVIVRVWVSEAKNY